MSRSSVLHQRVPPLQSAETFVMKKTSCDCISATDVKLNDKLTSSSATHNCLIRDKVLRELTQHFSQPISQLLSARLDKLLFYRLVQGGDVDRVSSILRYVRCHNPSWYCYLLTGQLQIDGMKTLETIRNNSEASLDQFRKNSGTSTEQLQKITQSNNTAETTSRNFRSLFASWLFYVFVMIPLFIVMTPFFYLLHGNILLNSHLKHRTRGRIRLPLLFAVLSNSAEMVRLFATHQPSIFRCTASDTDKSNVLHYLAEMSRKNALRSVQCARLLLKVFGADQTREVLTTTTNSHGFTALELAVHVGSSIYFTELLEMPNILKTTVLKISGEKFYSKKRNDFRSMSNDVTVTSLEDDYDSGSIMTAIDSERMEPVFKMNEFDCNEYPSTENEARDVVYSKMPLQGKVGFSLCHYDVTRYERGDVGLDSSFLLTLFVYRDLMKMTKAEVEAIVKCPLLTQWMRIKSKSLERIRAVQRTGSIVIIGLCAGYFLLIAGSTEQSVMNLLIQFWQTIGQQAAINSSVDVSSLSLYSDGPLNGSLTALIESTVDIMNLACRFNVSSHVSNWTSYGGGNSVPGLQSTSPLVAGVSAAVAATSTVILILDLVFRLLFLTRHFFFDGWSTGVRTSLSLMVCRVFVRPLPVSYVGRQLSTLSACCFMCMVWSATYSISIPAVSVSAANQISSYHTLTMVFAVVGTCTRYFDYVYSLRYRSFMNTSSHFVLTLCRMASFIVEFSLIYFGVTSFFATVFMLVVHDPACPYNPYPPFDKWLDSTVALFQMMLANNKLPENMTIDLMILYIIYAAMTTIVLLSLVTGISAGIADQVLSKRLLEIMINVESLKDAIEAETYTFVVMFPLFKAIHRWHLEREKKFVVKADKNGKIQKVHIELETLFK